MTPTTAQRDAAEAALAAVVESDAKSLIAANVPSFFQDEANSMLAKFLTTAILLRWSDAAVNAAMGVVVITGPDSA